MDYRDKFSLKGKTCFVLGGSGLIGSEVCKSFLDFDAKVVCLDLLFNKREEGILEEHDEFYFVEFDCSDLDNIERNLDEIVSLHGCPDVFVNASYPHTDSWKDSNFNELDLKSLRQNLEINLVSATWISRLAAELMKEKQIEGKIINLGSIYGLVGQNLNIYEGTSMKENAIYSIIKGALIQQTRQMASIYGDFNIRVNCVSPGGIEGPIAGENKKQEDRFYKNYAEHVPINRLAKAEEIAPAVIFLASDASSYVTGINLIIDGGWTAI
tara:strand:- start:32670 stop:33476 length:807 start_codon:yes stop_codon:yes gene_type:complete